MTYDRFDAGHTQPLFEISWEEDQQYRANPQIVTDLLREQVPVLDFVHWKVNRIEQGRAESQLPLNPESTNQHFTHQAALLLLAADYTGGIAVSSVLTGWPVVGVHPVRSPKSISLWLLKGEIKYLRPSVSDLTISAQIEPERCRRIQRRFLDGKVVLETVCVQFKNGDVDVAEAHLTYFARQSEKLRSDGASPDKINVLYELKLTSSAELIAGVRAREHGVSIDDPYAARMAGHHGVSLATRFCEKSPQLGGMVAARTRHLDASIMDFVETGGRDLVILGVGWDMRPFRLPLPAGMRVYELDFPTTLAERRRRLADLGVQTPAGIERIEVPIDVRSAPLDHALADHLAFDNRVFIAWEGMNMYFQDDEVCNVLWGMAPLLAHPASRLWVDIVDRQAVLTPEAFSGEVQAFMRGMQILGEPFTFGADSIEEFMRGNGLDCRQVVTSDVFLPGNRDPIYALYKFCLATRGTPVLAPSARHLRAEGPQTLAKPHVVPQVVAERQKDA